MGLFAAVIGGGTEMKRGNRRLSSLAFRSPGGQLFIATVLGAINAAAAVTASPAKAPAAGEAWRTPEWWLARAAGDARAASDHAIRRGVLDDVAVFRGPNADANAFGSHVDAILQKLSTLHEPEYRLDASLPYARLLASLGAKEQAVRVFDLAEKAAAESRMPRDFLPVDLHILRAQVKGPQAAFAGIEMIDDPLAQARCYIALLPMLARQPDHRAAYEQCCKRCADALARLRIPSATADLAIARARAADADSALATAAQIPPGYQRVRAELAIARAGEGAFRQKMLSAALADARLAPAEQRGEAFAAIAAAQVALGDDHGARQTLQDAEKRVDRAKGLAELGQAWKAAGDDKAARRVIAGARDALGPNPDVESCLAVAGACKAIGDVQAQRAALAKALAAGSRESDVRDRVDAATDVCSGFAEMGDPSAWQEAMAACERLVPAPGSTDETPDVPSRAEWRLDQQRHAIAQFAEHDRLADARTVLAKIATPKDRENALAFASADAAAVGAFAASRQLDAALNLARRAEIAHDRAYLAIRHQHLPEASQQIPLYPTPEARAEAEVAVAQALLEIELGIADPKPR
jgi:hypothetical protein